MTRSLHTYIATNPEETVTRYGHIFFRSLPETPKYVFVSWLLHPCKLSNLDSSVGFFLVQIPQLLVWKKFSGVFVTFISYLYCNSMEAEILFPVRLEVLVKRFTHRYSLLQFFMFISLGFFSKLVLGVAVKVIGLQKLLEIL